MWRAWLIALALILAGCQGEVEAPRLAPDASWAQKAAVDGKFALDLLEANHPGAVAVVGDKAFTLALKQARQRLALRAPQVRDRAGYDAVMHGLFQGFVDPHLRWRPYKPSEAVSWPGFILAYRDGVWRVAHASGARGLEGTVLIGCEGQDATLWAMPRIDGFAGDARLDADRKRLAAWLMLDEGNPFMARATQCRFQQADGSMIDRSLDWRAISRSEWKALAEKAEPTADAGRVVEAVEGGFWIGVNSLVDVGDLIDEVEAQGPALRAADFVVVDMRGNIGGSTQYSSRLYALILGSDRSLRAQKHPPCGRTYYRISKGNLDYIHSVWGGNFARTAGIRQALGQEFTRLYRACPVKGPLSVEAQTSAEPRLVLVVDRNCFSSCLMAVEHGRRLGALLVGEPTPLNLRYLESRGEEVPSGLGKVHTMMGVVSGVGPLGPYQPDHTYGGAMADDAGLKTWVLDEVLGTP